MTSVAVVGPGAVGSAVAAWLAQDDRLEVVVCTRSPRAGLVVESPDGRIAADVPVLTDPSTAKPVDWVLFTVKAYDVGPAAAWLPPLMSEGTRVAVLQNGVEQVARLRPYAAEDRIVPVIVDIPAERMPDGVVRQSRPGTLIVPAGASGTAFVDLFAATPIAASTTEDFVTTAWTKLCLNAAGAIGAVVRQPAGIARQEPVAELIRGVVAETVLAGRAEGAKLGDDLPDLVLQRMRDNPPLFVNSLVADRIAGRRTEVEARNGAVVRAGAAHGIPTPLNAMLTILVGSDPVPGFPEERTVHP
ncbi:2-dehydropantoate 2-reductase [Microbacterium tumbae]